MDNSMESLSADVCGGKFTAPDSNYKKTPVNLGEDDAIHGNQNYKTGQQEAKLSKTASPIHMTLRNHLPHNVVDKTSNIHTQYGVECNMVTASMYEASNKTGAPFESAFVYNCEKMRNDNSIFQQESANGQAYVYCNESGLIQESMNVRQEDSCGKYSLNSIGVVRSLDNMDLGQEGKIMPGRCEDYHSVVSDFLPEVPQSKEQLYPFISSERGPHCEAVPEKIYTSRHKSNSVYGMHPQQSHFMQIDVQRVQNFTEVSGAEKNCLENSATDEEPFCAGVCAGDVSVRQNGDVNFESGLKGSRDANEPSELLGDDYSERMESARAVEALMTLQGEAGSSFGPAVTWLESKNIHEPHEEVEGTADTPCVENREQSYVPNSSNLTELNAQVTNTKPEGKRRGRKSKKKYKKDHTRTGADNAHQSVARVSRRSQRKALEKNLASLNVKDGEVNENSKKKFRRDTGVNCENEIPGEQLACGGKGRKDSDKTKMSRSLGRTSVEENSDHLSEDDDSSVQSVQSSPSPAVHRKRKLKCRICNRTWKFRKDLNKHMKTHAGTKKFMCSVCSSGFINRTLLKKHLMTHSDMKLFTCPECLVNCHSLSELKLHQRLHTKVPVFSCSECSFTTKRQKELTKHTLVHSAGKVYHCQFCKFSSKRKYSLQRHVKTAHSAAQSHECSLCSFSTSAVDSFKVHVAMHASTRTTLCIICGAVIKKRPKLIEHLLSHSADENTTCKECGETCLTSHDYMLHLLSHKDESTSSPEDIHQVSVFDTPPLLNSNADSASDTCGFLARKNKVIMDTPAMETKLAQMSTVATRLADMTKVVTLLNDKTTVIFQLAEISTLATELAVISGNVLQSYKNTYGVAPEASGSKTKTPPTSSDVTEDSSSDDDDDYQMPPDLNTSADIKEEVQEGLYSSAEADMQIQVDFNGLPVSCVQKDDSFRSESSMKSKIKFLKCSRCNMAFTDTRSLKRHLLAHDNIRPYYCENCGRSFRRNEHLKKHMVTHSDERPFNCKECPYAAKTEHRLKIHALCHSQTKAYSCQHCTYTARTNYELNHHMKRHEPRCCSQCNFICYSRAELKKHVFTHSSFDCNECDFTTNDRAEYTKHTKKHSLVQHLCCELCGYSCDTMKKFKYHKLRHDNKTPYQCPDCDYRCSSRASFDCHRLKHAGLKPYLCSFCGAAFRKTSHLNQHLLIHKDEKAFKCSECNYSCRTKHNLKEHEMTHSGEKPFACKYCSFSCRRNKALQLHMLKHESTAMMIPSLQMSTMQFQHLQMPLQMPIIPS